MKQKKKKHSQPRINISETGEKCILKRSDDLLGEKLMECESGIDAFVVREEETRSYQSAEQLFCYPINVPVFCVSFSLLKPL